MPVTISSEYSSLKHFVISPDTALSQSWTFPIFFRSRKKMLLTLSCFLPPSHPQISLGNRGISQLKMAPSVKAGLILSIHKESLTFFSWFMFQLRRQWLYESVSTFGDHWCFRVHPLVRRTLRGAAGYPPNFLQLEVHAYFGAAHPGTSV